MIIQVVLAAGLSLCIGYAYVQQHKSKLVSYPIYVASTVGIYFVFFPDQANNLAALAGIGRGADLIFYCWVVISLIVSVNLQIKILSLNQVVTSLTREIAILNAELPPKAAKLGTAGT